MPAPCIKQSAGTPAISLCDILNPRFANHIDPNLARILHLLLNALCDIVRQDDHIVVRDLLRHDHDANLTARLHRKGLLDALV